MTVHDTDQSVLSRLTRRHFLLAGFSSVLLLAACGKGGGSSVSGPTPTSTIPPVAVAAPSPIGYSHVLRLDGPGAREVASAGGRFVQAEPFNFDSQTDLQRVRAAADVMRQVGGRLLVTVLNVNDPAANTISAAEYDARVRQVIAVVGTANVWLEAVSDSSNPNFRGFQDRARSIWPGEVVTTIHPRSVEQTFALLSPGRWTVMDNSPILASRLDGFTIKRLVKAAAQAKAILLLYDTGPSPWNSTVVRWLNEALSGSA